MAVTVTVTVTVGAGDSAVPEGEDGLEPNKSPSSSSGDMPMVGYGKGCEDGCPSVSN